jgi:transposase-like protein
MINGQTDPRRTSAGLGAVIAADACKAPGEIGALLRREGIYSSHLAAWRKQRAATERAALEPKKRGRKADPSLAEARRMDQLTRENDRLRRQLAQARTIIDVQKKVCTLLGLLTDETPAGKS